MAERGARPKVPAMRRRALKAANVLFTPLLPDDYLELVNPLWSTRELDLAAEQGVNLTPSELVAMPDASREPEAPMAKWAGVLQIGDNELPCFVLDDGRRVISRTGATTSLTGRRGGDLESYISVGALDGYLPRDFATT